MHVVKKTGRVALLFTILIAEENGKHGAHLAFIFTQVIKKVLGIVSSNFDSNFNHTCNPTFFLFNFSLFKCFKSRRKKHDGIARGMK